jgi:predicted MFS family arabinose efflux permease
MFTVGPLLVTLCAAAWSAQGALVLLQVLGVAGAVAVVTTPPSARWRSAPRTAHWLGALRSPALLVMLAAFLFVGVALGSITVAAFSYADTRGGSGTYGWLMAGIGLGSLIGGTAYGARSWPGEPEPRLRVLLALLALGYLPLALTPGPVAMTVLTVVAGVFLAPCIACAFVIIDRHAPGGTVTEAFSWLVTMFTVGAAVGTAVAGPVVEHHGARAGFGVPGAAALVAVLVLLGGARALRVPVRTLQPAP